MPDTQPFLFDRFRLDPQQRKLWCEDQPIDLQPKPLAVLHYLIVQAGRAVSKEELLKQVWPGVYVTRTALKVCIRAIREALGDEFEQPLYLETVGREGYRFIGDVVGSQPSGVRSLSLPPPSSALSPRQSALGPQSSVLVGREAELARLQRLFENAQAGERQLVFVTGEPGIGKTTVVDAFLTGIGQRGTGNGERTTDESQQATESRQRRSTDPSPLMPDARPLMPSMWIGRGQCLEQYGEGEAYLPVLEALGQWCRGPASPHVVAALVRYAPTWLVQMPALMEGVDLEGTQRKAAGATRERMLREMADMLEALAVDRCLVLVFEDLHWSDRATVELLAYLGQRRAPAKLLVLGTYRPVDVVLRSHPLKGIKHELDAHGQCQEVPLELLSPTEVGEYVTRRLPGSVATADIALALYRRTDGNALFMVNVIDYCLAQQLLVQEEGAWILKGNLEESEVPGSLQQMIARQLEESGEEERRVLEVASVVGVEFSTIVVANVLNRDPDSIEEVCETLAYRGQLLQEHGVDERPDGSLSGRYKFRHVLYQNLLYQRIAEVRRVRLHRMIGEYEERTQGEHAAEMAAELAMHFERGRDVERAILWLQKAGENAMRRNAPHEAITHFSHGLTLVQTLPEKPERMPRELAFQIALGTALMLTKGFAAAEVREVYARARELCRLIGETPQIVPVLRGLWSFYNARAEFSTARVLAEQLLRLTEDGHDVLPRSAAHMALGVTAYFRGEFLVAQEQLQQGLALFDPRQHNSPAVLAYGPHPGLIALFYLPLVLWMRGYPERALQVSEEGLSLARQLSHPHSQAFASIPATTLRQFRLEEQATREHAEAGMSLCREHGFGVYALMDAMLHGWSLAALGQGEAGVAELRQSLLSYQVAGAGLAKSYFLTLLAEAYGRIGQPHEGLTILTEAFAVGQENDEHVWEAEMYRQKGELLLQQGR